MEEKNFGFPFFFTAGKPEREAKEVCHKKAEAASSSSGETQGRSEMSKISIVGGIYRTAVTSGVLQMQYSPLLLPAGTARFQSSRRSPFDNCAGFGLLRCAQRRLFAPLFSKYVVRGFSLSSSQVTSQQPAQSLASMQDPCPKLVHLQECPEGIEVQFHGDVVSFFHYEWLHRCYCDVSVCVLGVRHF